MSDPPRKIFTGNRTSRAELVELLQWLFLAELLDRSDYVWFVAPTVDNAPIFDNGGGTFDSLDPGWGRRVVRLHDLVIRMASAGTRVSIVTHVVDQEASFTGDLRAAAQEHGLDHLVRVQARPWLSTPGILTHHGLLRGALDLGVDLIQPLDDVLIFETAADTLSAARTAFEANWPEAT